MASLLGAIPSTTHKAFLKTLSDAIFLGNPVFKKLYEKSIKYGGGEYIVEPLIVAQSNGGAYSRYDVLTAPDNEEVDSARYNWKQFYASVAIDGLAKAQNSGMEQAIDYWAAKLETMKLTLAEKLATSMFTVAGGGAADDLTLIEEICGRGTIEVGGLTTTEVATWAGTAQPNSIGAGLTRPTLLDSWMDCSEGEIKPDLGVTSKAGYAIVEELLMANQRFIGSDKNLGFENLLVHNTPVVFDSHVAVAGGTEYTANRLFWLNTDFLRLSIHKDHNFRLKEVEPDYQDAHLAFLFIYLNLTCNNRRFQGGVHNFT